MYPWFRFSHWPDQYESWWGFYSLPSVEEENPEYQDYIYRGEDSVVRRWLRAGADAWRLDVADELPDHFVAGIHAAARAEKKDAMIIGEVWEDGTTKVAYDVRRKHLLGGHCDALMNYPLRDAILAFFLGGKGEHFVEKMETIRENYPPYAFQNAMNALGTHDTPRILTLLALGTNGREQSRDWRASRWLNDQERQVGKERLMAASLLLFAFPGSPTIYYGDEAGMEGFEDPFNRRTYPWGKEDQELMEWFSALGGLRKTRFALRRGNLTYVAGRGPLLAFTRQCGEERLLAAFNRGDRARNLTFALGECPLNYLPEGQMPQLLLGEAQMEVKKGKLSLNLPPRSGILAAL